MTAKPPKFCFNCGAPRHAAARFCGSCGQAFADQAPPAVSEAERESRPLDHPPPPLPRAAPTVPTGSTWQVAVGSTLPDASRLFDLPPPKARRKLRREVQDTAPSPKGKSLWGSALWMSVTQGADMLTRALASGAPNDPNLPLRLGIAAAVAVFSISLGSMPRLRSILVRLGTLAMGVLQGQAVMPLIQQAVLDPSLLRDLAPNLGAHAVGLMALFKLFRAATGRPA